MKNSDSPSKQVWKRFLKNKLAVGGLVFILMLILVCLLGYLITPDQSPQANEMHLSLTNRKPGRSFRFLIISRNDRIKKVNVLEKMLYGQELNFKSIPVTSIRKSGSHIYAREYIGDDEIAEEKAYSLVSGAYEYEKKYWLGTDIYGRDLLSRLLIGTRVSLSVGLMSVLISLFIGVSLGAIAGYIGGKTDAAISWLMNVIWSLPSLLLVIAISFALGKGFWQIFIAVGLSTWVDVARVVRGQVMALKEVEFAEASKALGFSITRIISRHILPNIAGPILVMASANFAAAILLETGLSFLGFGAQPPMPSWGTMIKEHYGYIIMDAAYLAILPGLAIMLTVYAFNLLAIGLRDAFDVKSQNVSL